MYSFLIVDDEPIIRKGLHMILKRSQLTVSMIREAENGEEALEYLAKEDFDVLVTDIRMPKMDGLELCRRVQTSYPNMIILLVTGYDDFKYAQQAIAYGVKGYILKPVDELAFKKSIHQALEKTAAHGKNNHVSLEQIDGLIGSLEKVLWEGADMEIRQVCIRLFEVFQNLPLSYCTNTLSEILEMTLKRLSQRLGYSFKLSIKEFRGNNKLELQRWLEEAISFIRKEIHDKKAVQGFELIDLAKRYLEEDCNITLEDISRKVGMSPNYFSPIFKAKTGVTFIEYRTELRMKKAIELLCQPVKSITDITFAVGYSDITHFTRTFKKYTGMTPSEFREKRGLR